jgi:hypothetical protein
VLRRGRPSGRGLVGIDMRRCVDDMPKPDGASSARKLGDAGGVVEPAKVDVFDGVKFGDMEVGNVVGVKFGDKGAHEVDAVKDAEVVGRKFGDIEA